MKTVTRLVLLTTLATGTAVAQDLANVPSGTYELDPSHAYIDFSYNHLGLSNPSLSFDEFTVELDLDNENPANSSVRVTIDPNSVQAGSDIWHEHLTSSDWFNVSEYPEITFESTSIEPGEDGALTVEGDLTIKDQTQPVTLDVTINGAMEHPMNGTPTIGLSATGEVLRSDFGMDKFAPNVSDEVQINIQSELAQAS